MRTKIADLTEADAEREKEIYLWSEVARSGCMAPEDAYRVLKQERDFMEYLLHEYELDDAEGWQPDPVSLVIYDAGME